MTQVTHFPKSPARARVGEFSETASPASFVTSSLCPRRSDNPCGSPVSAAADGDHSQTPWFRPKDRQPQRCNLCNFHPVTQGHCDGCPEAGREPANDAYRAGYCRWCHANLTGPAAPNANPATAGTPGGAPDGRRRYRCGHHRARTHARPGPLPVVCSHPRPLARWRAQRIPGTHLRHPGAATRSPPPPSNLTG